MKILTCVGIILASLTMASGNLNLSSDTGSIDTGAICSQFQASFNESAAQTYDALLNTKGIYSSYLIAIKLANKSKIESNRKNLIKDARRLYIRYERIHADYEKKYRDHVKLVEEYKKHCKVNVSAGVYEPKKASQI